jgi:hypothetical protein
MKKKDDKKNAKKSKKKNVSKYNFIDGPDSNPKPKLPNKRR